MRVITLDPVLFLAGQGGGDGEYGFPNIPNSATTYTIDLALNSGESLLAAWYAPLDNIHALSAFATIQVFAAGAHVGISAHGYNGASDRIRIAVYALVV